MKERDETPANPTHPVRILGIETSCDETAAAVVEDGARICSSVVASQWATHGKYGGVVPELASREHLRAIVPIVRQAVEDAGLSYPQLDAIAVTQGPGLVGSLLVGLTYAKSLSLALGKPLVAVNHLEGHIHAVILEERLAGRPDPEFPALALVVSGGHTLLTVAERAAEKDSVSSVRSVPSESSDDSFLFSYCILGRTRDDAAGEAYDKVAKLLGYGYPGGPVLDRLAPYGDPDAVSFTKPKMKGNSLDFSFSGIKTAVLRYVEARGLASEIAERNTFRKRNPKASLVPTGVVDLDELLAHSSRTTLDLIASFQRALVDDLVEHTLEAAEREGVNSIFVTGGVAANSLLRERLSSLPRNPSDQKPQTTGMPPVYFPRLALSTDNAAMIAAAAFPKYLAGQFAAWNIPPDASLALESEPRA